MVFFDYLFSEDIKRIQNLIISIQFVKFTTYNGLIEVILNSVPKPITDTNQSL